MDNEARLKLQLKVEQQLMQNEFIQKKKHTKNPIAALD